MEKDKTIFNDPQKLQKTREETADYFKTGEDYNEKLRSMFGLSDDKERRKKELARQIVYGKR